MVEICCFLFWYFFQTVVRGNILFAFLLLQSKKVLHSISCMCFCLNCVICPTVKFFAIVLNMCYMLVTGSRLCRFVKITTKNPSAIFICVSHLLSCEYSAVPHAITIYFHVVLGLEPASFQALRVVSSIFFFFFLYAFSSFLWFFAPPQRNIFHRNVPYISSHFIFFWFNLLHILHARVRHIHTTKSTKEQEVHCSVVNLQNKPTTHTHTHSRITSSFCQKGIYGSCNRLD